MANPTLLWQLTLPDGSSAHCLLFPTWPTHTVVWYVNEQVHQIHPFRDYPQVMAKAEELRERLMQPPD